MNVIDMEYDYTKLLDRLYDKLPGNVMNKERFETPKAISAVEGSKTVISNYKQICDTLRRSPTHLLKFLLKEMATSGNVDGQRLVLSGKFYPYVINEKIGIYVNLYVICPTCNRPDTDIIDEGRIKMLKCSACGAKSSVKPLV